MCRALARRPPHPYTDDPRRTNALSALLKNLSITLGESVLGKGLNFLVILLLTRSLGPEDYGQFSMVFVTVALCSALFDFGMENTAVRFSARYPTDRHGIFGLYLLAKLLSLGVLLVLFAGIGPAVLTWIDKAAVVEFIPYLMLGLVGESLFLLNDTWLQANQWFRLRAVMNVTRYAVTLLYVLLLLGWEQFSLAQVMWLYALPLLMSVLFVGVYARFIGDFFRRWRNWAYLQDMLHYERWMMVFSVGNNLLGRIDFFMLSLWVGFYQLGVYNAAFQLCAVVSFLPLALGKVLLPALSGLDEAEIRQTTSRVVRMTLRLLLGIVLLLPAVGWGLPMLLGQAYGEAAPVAQLLLLAVSGALVTMPYEQALYAMGRPQVLCLGKYAQLGVIVVLNALLIPSMGMYAVALSALLARLFYLGFVVNHYRESQNHLVYTSLEAR